MLGWQDLRQAYRRSNLGPFWITGGMAIQIATIGIVFGMIFKSETKDYIPFLAVSIVVWTFVSATISEGCNSFIASESMIKQINLPPLVYVGRTVWKNLLTLGHNVVILPVVFLIFQRPLSFLFLLALLGVLILTLTLAAVSAVLGIISARYRDLPPMVNSMLTVAFYVTPVMWFPELIGNNQLAHLLLGLNPLYHLLQITRLPILGQWPTLENWGVSIVFLACSSLLAIFVIRKSRSQLAFWV